LAAGAAVAAACAGTFCASWSSALLCDDFDTKSSVSQEGLQQQTNQGGGTFALNTGTFYTPPNSAQGTTNAFEGGSGSAAQLGGPLWKGAQPPPGVITCDLEVQAAQLSDASSDTASLVTLVITDGAGLVRSELSLVVDSLGNLTFEQQVGDEPRPTDHSGDPPDSSVDGEAGDEGDSGVSDAGSSTESGPQPSDSGSPAPDSGSAMDSGSGPDTGSASDSGSAPDSTLALDTGTVLDTGSTADIGVGPEAAMPDSGSAVADGASTEAAARDAGAADGAGDAAQAADAEAPDVEITDAPIAAPVLGSLEAGAWTFVELVLTTTSSGTQFSVTAGGAAKSGSLAQPLPSPMSATLMVGPVDRGGSSSGWSIYYDNVVCH
jgi:hypothetical protein